MSKNGLKIKTIKAGSLYGYNLGVRNTYESNDAVFNNSLFSIFLERNGLNSYKDISTRDIICLDFDYGSRSYEEELSRITETINKEKGKEVIDEEKLNCLNLILESTKQNKDKFNKKSKEEIREEF
ncbi:MAG: hypothetical protein ACRDDY_00890, partial [Clostridium sp.]|uniref:hypothetical protein n=1 Tax=Clostridium sp. TaxID=1506 RepID=UPI003EE747DA